jgi:mono/diheme cytochrome c family protein
MIKGFGMSEVLRKFRAAATLSLMLLALKGIASSQTTPPNDPGTTTYKTYCVGCHAVDGSGTALGRRLHAPDLRTKEVKEKPSADLTQIINAGKNAMPAFGTKLNSQQVQQVLDYIHQFDDDDATTSK